MNEFAHLVVFVFKCLRVMQIMTHPLAFLVIMGAVIAAGFAIRLAVKGIRRLRTAQRSPEETT